MMDTMFFVPSRLVTLLSIAGLTLVPIDVQGAKKAQKAKTPGTIHYEVVAAESTNRAAAIKTARRLSDRTRLPLVEASVSEPPKATQTVGTAVAIHSPSPSTFVVTAYFGTDRETADAMRRLARKHAKRVRVTQRAVRNVDSLDQTYASYAQSYVTVLASNKDCAAAMRQARAIAKKLKVPFSSRDLVCDKKLGLTWPHDYKPDIYAGSYMGRRYNNCGKQDECISVERSEYYRFRKGLYIVVGSLTGKKEATAVLARYRRSIPSAYMKQTTLYMGCMH